MDLNSWLSNRTRNLAVFLENLEIVAEPWIRQGIHLGYTDHTIEHSKRVVEYLGKLIEPSMFPENLLSELEVCILIAAAYTHDTGMQDQRNYRLEEIRDDHHILSGNINKEISKQIVSQTLTITAEPFPGIFDMVALVAEGHRKEDLSNPKYDSVNVSGHSIRFRLLAALLRLADELDMDHRRAFIPMTDLQNLPPETLIHWFKSYYVSAIEIKNNLIIIHYQFPSGKVKDYFRIFDRIVGEKIRVVLDRLHSILQEFGIQVQMGDPKTKEWDGIRDLPNGVKELAIKEAYESARENREYKRTTEDIAFLKKYLRI